MSIRLGYDLTIEQSQKLVMTPELIQAIRILQLNSQELDMFVQEEIMNNPVLEQEHREDKNSESLESDEERRMDVDWQEYLKDRQYDDISYRSHLQKDPEKEENRYEQFTASAESITEHLEIQLDVATDDSMVRKAGIFIIESLDDNGYMTLTEEEIAAALSMDIEIVRKAAEYIKTFDPYGVGASSLGECLILQLRQMGMCSEAYERLLTEFLDQVASNRLQQIAKKLGMQVQELQKMVDVIRHLDPKPGRQFDNGADIRYVTPDVTVELTEEEALAYINDDSVPSLMVSSYYKNLVNQAGNDPELSQYLNDRINSAVWLIKNINQRKQTIQKVAQAVVSRQEEFFRRGSKHLKPLTLKEVAEEVEMHESTISRAINGKYLQSDRGVFELKYFFSSGLNAGGEGDSISSTSVKGLIKEIVDGEDPKSPYSDQDMVGMLKEKGISISRRTVAKYREEMHILSSSKRRRY